MFTRKQKYGVFILLIMIIAMLGNIIVDPSCTDCDKEPYIIHDTTTVTVTEIQTDTVEVEKLVTQYKTNTVTDTLTQIEEKIKYVDKIVIDTVHHVSDAHAQVMFEYFLTGKFEQEVAFKSFIRLDKFLYETTYYLIDDCCYEMYVDTVQMTYHGPDPLGFGSWSVEQTGE